MKRVDWTARKDWVRFTRAQRRCECRRCPGCAEPDLDKRCRAEHGVAHPKSWQIIELTAVHLGLDLEHDGPNQWRALCQNCLQARDSALDRDRQAGIPDNTYALFPEG